MDYSCQKPTIYELSTYSGKVFHAQRCVIHSGFGWIHYIYIKQRYATKVWCLSSFSGAWKPATGITSPEFGVQAFPVHHAKVVCYSEWGLGLGDGLASHIENNLSSYLFPGQSTYIAQCLSRKPCQDLREQFVNAISVSQQDSWTFRGNLSILIICFQEKIFKIVYFNVIYIHEKLFARSYLMILFINQSL